MCVEEKKRGDGRGNICCPFLPSFLIEFPGWSKSQNKSILLFSSTLPRGKKRLGHCSNKARGRIEPTGQTNPPPLLFLPPLTGAIRLQPMFENHKTFAKLIKLGLPNVSKSINVFWSNAKKNQNVTFYSIVGEFPLVCAASDNQRWWLINTRSRWFRSWVVVSSCIVIPPFPHPFHPPTQADGAKQKSFPLKRRGSLEIRPSVHKRSNLDSDTSTVLT